MVPDWSDEQLVAYLRRAYHAVDGLWFMMVEDCAGFAAALDADRRVWQVLAKIQARKAREVTGRPGNAPEDLLACFSLKLTADGHCFDAAVDSNAVEFTIHRCPWLDLLQGSGREHLARQVAETVCPTEGAAWCREFGDAYDYSMPALMCGGAGECVMRFGRRR